jgi:hypothetical protein
LYLRENAAEIDENKNGISKRICHLFKISDYEMILQVDIHRRHYLG